MIKYTERRTARIWHETWSGEAKSWSVITDTRIVAALQQTGNKVVLELRKNSNLFSTILERTVGGYSAVQYCRTDGRMHCINGPAYVEFKNIDINDAAERIVNMHAPDILLSDKPYKQHWSVRDRYLYGFESIPKTEESLIKYAEQTGFFREVVEIGLANKWLSPSVSETLNIMSEF